MTPRHTQLLTELANGFRSGTDLLLDTKWLSDNNVTIHECFDLAEAIADALTDRFGLAVPERRR